LYNKHFDLSTCALTDFDFVRAASATDLQLTPASTTPAPGSATREESSSAGPITAAPAPEPSAPEESTLAEPTPEADATLPDLPPPELQQVETGAGGQEQVEAPDVIVRVFVMLDLYFDSVKCMLVSVKLLCKVEEIGVCM
jgi:hypothetical protein